MIGAISNFSQLPVPHGVRAANQQPTAAIPHGGLILQKWPHGVLNEKRPPICRIAGAVPTRRPDSPKGAGSFAKQPITSSPCRKLPEAAVPREEPRFRGLLGLLEDVSPIDQRQSIFLVKPDSVLLKVEILLAAIRAVKRARRDWQAWIGDPGRDGLAALLYIAYLDVEP
jgi:hypothetical protein